MAHRSIRFSPELFARFEDFRHASREKPLSRQQAISLTIEHALTYGCHAAHQPAVTHPIDSRATRRPNPIKYRLRDHHEARILQLCTLHVISPSTCIQHLVRRGIDIIQAKQERERHSRQLESDSHLNPTHVAKVNPAARPNRRRTANE